MIKAEWSKIFQSKKVLVAIIAVLFVPVLYAGMFLWAFWDPYAHLEDLPVAIVNNDEGATIEGKEEQFGKELVDNLIKSKNFKFTETSQAQGSKGLKNRDYYLEIVIPKDFSKNAGSILEDDPEQMKIIYKPNEGFNFLGGQIGNSAVELVRKEVNKQVSATYAKTLYANIKKMGDGFGDAADGAGKLEKGAGQLGKGANQLNDGIQSAKDGATQLADGAKSAAVGSNDLKNGIDSATNGANQLNNGAKSAASGSTELKSGIDSAKDGSSQLQSGSNDLKKGTESLVSGLEGNTSNINALNNGAQKINSGVGTLSTGLSQLAPGASNVSAGVSQLVTGLGEMPAQISSLQTGVANLNSGASDLTKGTESLAAGTKQLIAQIKAMNLPADQEKELLATATAIDSGASNVNAGATKVSAGTTQLNNSVAGIKAPTTNDLTALKQGAAQVSAGLEKMNKSVSSELAPGTKQLAAGTDKLASNWSTSIAGAKKLDAGAGQLNTGITSLNNGLGQLQTGSGKLVSGLGTLSNGTQSLVSGMGQLQTGSGQLASGLGTLSNGTQSLVSGAVQLADGSQQLADGTTELKGGAGTLQSSLADAHKTASSVNATQKTYDMVGEPVDVEKQEINKVPNYGTGFAPYFISLGLFVGALLISIVFPLIEPAIKPKNGFSWFASKSVVLAVVGLIQSLIVVAISIFVLKIEIANVGAFILMTLISSYVFIALVQMLVTILGDPGRFLAIIILILQLTTSAGTFPLELVPKALHIFNTILPMTYSVQGFKAAISTGDMGFFGFNSGILLLYMVVFLAITCGFFALLFAKRHSKEAAAE
ncbi:MAG TPA: YhgE/Pip domain-containing protein [Rummeliibacillus sp.]|nr:YhgE/Pip domain-containing protein [Rummeliibacillus sp.]